MSVRSIDLKGMFKEIEMIQKKYGVPKGMGFIPDKLEIVLERREIDKFDLTYSEFFNYLPHHALKMAIENVIQLIQMMGFPSEKIIQMENGVKVQISGDSRVTLFPIMEILLQNKGKESEIRSNLDLISETYQIFANLLDFQWNWSDETESKFNNFLMIWNKVVQEYPSITSEIEAVIKKYTEIPNPHENNS